ncbi:MAG TPA: TfoX/Sxy family protein [Acidimicrobiia bacterium]
MAYDETLAVRIRDHLGDDPAIVEKKMFGGVAFMYQGNMAVGTHKDGLMVRVDPDEHESALGEAGVREFDMTGRSMKGWVVVDAEAIADDPSLASWIERGVDYAGSLPPK